MSGIFLTQQTFSNHVDQFLFDRVSKGRTKRTVELYRSELFLFFNWLENVSKIESITPDVLRKYFIDLANRRNKGGIHSSYRVVRAFFNWYDGEYEPEWKNPIRKVKISPSKIPPLPEIPLEDIQKLLGACENRFKLRDIAILKCLVDTGCRASEFLSLNYGDINFNSGSVLIRHGKGDKSRIVWLGPKAKKALLEYLHTRDNIELNSPLWLNDENARLQFFGLRGLMKRLCVRAGVTYRGLHAFRRTFGITLYRKGIDILTISRLLGHSSIEVTKRYLNLGNEDLRSAHLRASPADTLD